MGTLSLQKTWPIKNFLKKSIAVPIKKMHLFFQRFIRTLNISKKAKGQTSPSPHNPNDQFQELPNDIFSKQKKVLITRFFLIIFFTNLCTFFLAIPHKGPIDSTLGPANGHIFLQLPLKILFPVDTSKEQNKVVINDVKGNTLFPVAWISTKDGLKKNEEKIKIEVEIEHYRHFIKNYHHYLESDPDIQERFVAVPFVEGLASTLKQSSNTLKKENSHEIIF